MEENRRRRRGVALDTETIFRTLEESSFGGSKDDRRRARNELPVSPKGENVKGIKVKFDRAADKYPTEVELLMTDGEWVKYQIKIDQPAPRFDENKEGPEKEDRKTGYKPRRTRA